VQVAGEYLGVLQLMDQVSNAEENYRQLLLSSRRARRLSESGRLEAIQVDQSLQDELTARERWISAQQSYAHALDNLKLTLGLPADAAIELDRGELQRLAQSAQEAMATADAKTAEPEAAVSIPPAPAEETGPNEPPEQSPAVEPQEKPALAQGDAAGASTPASAPASEPAEPAEPAAAAGQEDVLAANQPVDLVPPSPKGGPLEMDETQAVRIALDNRLDLRSAIGQVYDAQRKVVVAADALKADVALTGSGSLGSGRSVYSADQPDARLEPQHGLYAAGAQVNLPLERTAERNAYRNSLIYLQQATRSVQSLEDAIKLQVRDDLRQLLQSRESYFIQAQAAKLAQRRVDSTQLFLQAGRAQIRDLLEAQDALINARDAVTAALVSYRVTSLQFQRDLDVLEIDEKGLWREYQPK
jgi:outer membrane protein TolC